MNSRKFLRKERKGSPIRIRKSREWNDSEKIGLYISPETRLALSLWALQTPPSRVPTLLNSPEVQQLVAARYQGSRKLSVKMVQGALSDFYQHLEHVVIVAAIILDIKFERLTEPEVRRIVRAAIERDMRQLDRDNPNWRDMQP